MAVHASLDTNCLLRWILRDVPEQADAVASNLTSGQSFHLADQAIIEMIYVLEKTYSLPRVAIVDIVNLLMAESQFSWNREFFANIMVPYQMHNSLSVVDCYLAHDALRASATPLYTFNKQLIKKMPQAELLSLA